MLNHWQQIAQQQQQQQAAARARQLAWRNEQFRTASLNQAHQQRKAEEQWQRQEDARRVHPYGPVPIDAWKQLKKGEGTWHFNGWTVSKYGHRQLEHWRTIWLTCTKVGNEVLADIQEKEERQRQAKEALEERKRQMRAEIATRRAMQERYRLDKGEVVRIKCPQSELDGRLGRVMSMEMVGEVMMARVLVDPVPAGHPMANVPPRNRPSGFAPVSYQLKAELLTREHPEAIL